MGKQSTTYTINFKAQYDSLGKLENELNKIKKQSGELNLTEKEQEKVQELILKVKQLRELTDSKMGDGHLLDPSDFKLLEKSFNKLITQANNFSSALIKMLPVDLQSKIQNLQKQVNDLNKINQTLGSQKGFSTKKFNKEANSIAMNNIQAAGPSANIVDSKGNLISTYADLKQRAEELTSEARELNQEEKQLLVVWQQVEQEVKPIMDAWQTEWDELTKQIEENRKKVLELMDTSKKLANTNNKDMPMELDPNSATAYNSFTDTVVNLTEAMSKSSGVAQKHEQEVAKGTKTQYAHKVQTDKLTHSYDKNRTTLGKAVHNVVSYGSALALVRGIYHKLIQTITEMDQALTSMTVVTQLSRDQAWELTGTLQQLAKQTGMTSTEIANMTTMYLQQGKTLSDSLKLTEAAAKAARIAGISGSESINLLTNAMNGFQLEASQAMEVSDKFAALAAAAATDYEELATALSKVAAQANLAGMSMDFTLGLLTKGIEVTREAPETIGTALKTVISRMRELTDYGETLEDGIDVNRVDTALKNIGVSLLDNNREFRDLEEVLTEVGMKWDTLNKNQQANVAVALAGTRQQSRLIAMLQDFDRTQELVNISMKSAGATAAQHRKYMEGLEAATTKLTTSYQQLITSFMNSDAVIKTINALSTGLEFLAEHIELVGIVAGGLAAAYLVLNKAQLIHKGVVLLSSLLNIQLAGSELMVLKAENARKLKLAELTLEELKASGASSLSIMIAQSKVEALKSEARALDSLTDETAENTAGQLVNAGSSAAQATGYLGVSSAAGLAKIAVQKFTEAMKKNWILLLIGAIVALVAAWWSFNKETEAAKKLMESLGGIFKSLMSAVQPLFDALMVIIDVIFGIINILMPILTFIIDVFAANLVVYINQLLAPLKIAMFIIQVVFGIIKHVVDSVLSIVEGVDDTSRGMKFLKTAIGALLDPLGAVYRFFDMIQQKLLETINTVPGLRKFLETIGIIDPEEEKSKASDAMTKIQEQVYDNRQKSSTLSPLIEEYEQLSKKAIKTSEELERMKEIENEIGSMDEFYLNKNGTIKIQTVRNVIDEANKEVEQGLQEGYAAAKMYVSLGIITDEVKAGITDVYTEQARLLAENGEISAETANAIATSFQQTINNMSNEEIQALDKMGDEGYKNLYNSISQFETKRAALIEDGADTLENQISTYQSALETVPDDAKDAFNSIYSLYAEYVSMIQQLGLKGKDKADFLAKMELLGLDQIEFEEIRKAYLEENQEKTEADFNAWFANTINTAGSDKASLITALMSGGGQAFQNIVEDATVASNQEILESYTKTASAIDNLSELSKKAKAGTLTAEDIRQLEASNPEIFQDEAFWRGEYDADRAKREAAKVAIADLNTRLALAKQQGDESQIASLNKQIEYFKYAELYTSEIWQNALEITNQQAEQTRLQSKLNKLIEEYEAATDPVKKKALLKEQAHIYKQMAQNAKSIFNEEQRMLYDEAINKGYVVDGKIVATTEELRTLGISSAMYNFLEKEADNIQNYHDYTEEYLNGYKSIVEMEYNNQKEILEERKDQYQEYFDAMDALTEEQERQQSRDSIINQLSAIAGGSDAASNNLRKDLLGQLADLNKEEADARKQAMRDAAIQRIDDNIADIDKGIKALNGLTEQEVETMLHGLGYSTGGLVNYTGHAWVHGTSSKPEAFLNANDTQLIQNLVSSLNYGSLQGVLTSNTETNNIVIENVNISTAQLNNNQDFKNSAQIFAEEFSKAMRQRGLNKNVKK